MVRRPLLVFDATLGGLAGAGEVDELTMLLSSSPGGLFGMSMLEGSDGRLAAGFTSGFVGAPDVIACMVAAA